MANHLRRQIRERVVALVTGLSTTGSRVFEGRAYPEEPSKLPCLLVYDRDEELEPATLSPAGTRTMVSNLSINIEGYTQSGSGQAVLNSLAQIQKEVQAALAGDVTLSSLAGDSFLSSASVEVSSDGNKPTGTNVMTYVVRYGYTENAPDTATLKI